MCWLVEGHSDLWVHIFHGAPGVRGGIRGARSRTWGVEWPPSRT